MLAPAGREDVLLAVLEAGADAVYLSGKQFNMRRHRRDFHFSDEALTRAVETVRALGRRLYVTVNILLGQDEVPALRRYLAFLDGIGVDAIIVQDLAVVRLAQEMGFRPELHSSTMMNISSVEAARFLRKVGFTRAVTSRDITLVDVRRIREESGLEVEYFVHGDLCSVLSGQCLSSGLLFGKSSNRGQCMKPCRWSYDLVSETSGRVVREHAHLLATKDLCLLQHVPELVLHGIDSLKIEGRMRSAEVLVPIVEAYRSALDRVVSEPLRPAKLFCEATARHRERTRSLTTGFAFQCPSSDIMDTSGEREPVIFSTHGRLTTQEGAEFAEFAESADSAACDAPEVALTVVVGSSSGAEAALAAGCDQLVLSWEGDLTVEGGWELAEIRDISAASQEAGANVLMTTPCVLNEREVLDLRQFVDLTPPVDGYVVTGLAALEVLADCGATLWASERLNVMNAEAALFLEDFGVTRIMPGLEISLPVLRSMMEAAPGCQFDLLAHGPLTGMLVEHCLIAMNTQQISKSDFCQMPCAADHFCLVDRKGARRRIAVDRYCRNHILLEHDLAMLPVLGALLAVAPASIRLDARTYEPEQVGVLAEFYRRGLDQPGALETVQAEFALAFSPEAHSFGGYLRGICRDEEISRLDLKREEQNES